MTTQPGRSRSARLLDAVTHSGPGYDTTPNATASNTTSRLHHLLDRMQRGVLLPEEREQLAGLVRLLQARVNDQDRAASVAVSAIRLMNEAGAQRAAAEARVRELGANTATLRDALAAVTGQCRSLETELAAERSTIDRVRDLAGRYQMWHEGGWAPSSAADVAREYRAAVDGQPDDTGNTSPTVRS
ncbi:hypothetical protein AB0K62_13625 [Streptomyces halstedii]|uniref:hypothetical protein n=1 Tax=Streptomyces halstedii TaxID=1944 RepID=UPI0034605CE0